MTFFPFLCCDRVVLARSLRYCQVTVEKLKQTGIEVMWHGKRDNEGSHYCAQCEVRCLTKALFSHNFFLQYLCNFSLADWWRAIISENNNFGNDSMMAQFVYLCLSRATVWETLTVNFIVKKKTYNNFPWSMLFLTLKWRQNAKKFGSFCRNQTIEFSGGLIAKL